MGCSPPGSSVRGILQARILEWLPFPSPEDLPNPGIEPGSPALRADALPSEPPGKTHGEHKGLRSTWGPDGQVFALQEMLEPRFHRGEDNRVHNNK